MKINDKQVQDILQMGVSQRSRGHHLKNFVGVSPQTPIFRHNSYRKTIFPFEIQSTGKDLRYARVSPTLNLTSTSTLIVQLAMGLHLEEKSGKGQGRSWAEAGGHPMYGP